MLLVYAGGLLATLAALLNDLQAGVHSAQFFFAMDGAMALTMLTAMTLVWRGRDHTATLAVPVIMIVFSLGSLAGALDGHPEDFYSGWARWYPVFIGVNGLLMSQRSAVLVTALSVTWTAAYYPLFSGVLVGTPDEFMPGDAIDMLSIELLMGVITVTTIRYIEAELVRNRKLNAGLEATVAKRTEQLSHTISDRQTVLDNMADGLIAMGSDGTIRVSNDQLSRLFGIECTVGSTRSVGVLPMDLLPLVEQVRQSGTAATEHIELPGKRIGKVTVTPIPGKAPPYGIVALVRDVTIEQEVDRLKTEFIATVSHELRTPLTSVLGFSKVIRARLEKRVAPALPAEAEGAQKAMDQALSNLGIVVSEGERLTALINDVLDIAKMEAGRVVWRKDPVDVAALLTSSANAVSTLFPAQRDVVLKVECAEQLPVVIGDEHRLMQILVNLLSNASKFTEAGTVTLSAQPVDTGVELSVSDTGAGVPQEQLGAIFERFQQVEDTLTDKPQGTGLGLPICQQIAQAHDSQIEVSSTVSQGSRFWFVLKV